jgi:hypothetical protein
LYVNEEFVQQWEEERKQGKFKYILAHTIRYFNIIFWGIVVISFLGVVFVSIYTGTNVFDILTIQVLKKTLFNFTVLFTGFTISEYLEWNKIEKKYNKLLNNK